jgi:hypothetical protein
MSEPEITEINDKREKKDFKGISFSKFKKTDVTKELLKSLLQSKIESSCYWSAELVCAGHYADLWEILLFFYSKYIHLGNPKLAIYLELRMKHFKEIVNNGYLNNELRMRNNIKIRKLFAEIVCILCHSKQKHSFDNVKISKTDYDMTHMTDRFKAPNVQYAEKAFMPEDPKELFVAINELAYDISKDGKNVMNACYWIEWIMEFGNICKKKKEKSRCERRTNIPVDPKFQMEIIWIVWDLFLKETENHNPLVQKIIKSLLTLFTLRYKAGYEKKRKNILYFVVSLLCENINVQEEIIKESQKDIIANVVKKIDAIYSQIKKNEESTGTDYLFKNVKSENLEKTIEKLEKMNSFGETFVPRT